MVFFSPFINLRQELDRSKTGERQVEDVSLLLSRETEAQGI